MKKYLFLFVVCFLVLVTIPKVIAPKTVSAQNFISTNYILSDPVFGESGPYVSSPSFKERSALGQLVTGVSQSTNFILKSGFEYYAGQSVPSITMSLNTNLINFNTVAPNTIVNAPISTAGVQTTTPLTTATRFATSVEYGGYVYEIGGVNSSGTVLATVDYAPISSSGTIGTWTATTSLPTATDQATSVEYNGYVYEIGGCSSTCPTTTVDYAPINSDGTLGSWTATTPLLAATENATSVVYNGYVYEIGGNNGSAEITTVDYAHISSNGTLGAWTSTTSLPTATAYSSSIVYDNYVYIMGGGDPGKSLYATVDYAHINSDGTLGSWTATTSLPAVIYQATSVMYNGYVYEIGGNNGSALSTIDYAPINSNGTIGTWIATTPLPTATSFATSVVYNGYVYEIGGGGNGVAFSTVDYFSIISATSIITVSSNAESGYNLYISQNNNLTNQQGDTIPPVNNGATSTTAAPWTSASYYGLGYNCSASNTYKQTVLANSPIGFWTLGETSGTTAYDLSGNSNNGTYTGGYTQGEQGPISNSNLGRSTYFNGSSGYVEAPLGTYFGNNNPFTVGAWVYVSGSSNGPIFGVTQDNPPNGWRMPFLSLAGTTIYGWIYNNTILSYTVTPGWHFISLTYTPSGSGTGILYVDGVQVAIGTGQYSGSGTFDYFTTYINSGVAPSGVNTYLNGKISNVMAFESQLSSTQIQTLFNDGINSTQAVCNTDFISSSYYRQLSSTNTEFASYSSIATNQEIAVGYAVNVSNIQASGIYTNNITYTLTGNY
jgi:N-acetylneuraminic acid mutarotase